MALPETTTVPIRLEDGHVQGTFCRSNVANDPTLDERDLRFVRAFADVAGFQIDRELARSASRAAKSMRIARAAWQHHGTAT